MFEESASAIPSSIWASMNSWFTPTVLFVLLNVMIGTIALTSSFANQKQNHPQNDTNRQKIVRSPSVLQRLKSINFYTHYRSHQEPHQDFRNKPSSNSDSLSHLQAQAPDTQNLFFFQENSQENILTQSHYIFEQTHEQNPQENQTQFDFGQTHQHKPQVSEIHFVFEEKDSFFYDFKQTHQQNPQEQQTQFDFGQTHQQNPQKSETHFVFHEKDSIFDDFKQAHDEEKVDEGSELQSMDEVYSQLTGNHFNRSKSDSLPASGEIPTKLPAKMKKSASLKSAFGHFEEEDVVEARRPATVRDRGRAKQAEDDEEVDAKADDFINKFKQQLKLQRLDSIIRYKDVIGRGKGGRS